VNHLLCIIGTCAASALCFILGCYVPVLVAITLWACALGIGALAVAFVSGAITQGRDDREYRQRRYEARWHY